jgi:hypothetical protein
MKLFLSLFFIFLFSASPALAWTSNYTTNGTYSLTWTNLDILALPALNGCSGSSDPFELMPSFGWKNGVILPGNDMTNADGVAVADGLGYIPVSDFEVSLQAFTQADILTWGDLQDPQIPNPDNMMLSVTYNNQNRDCIYTESISPSFLISSLPYPPSSTSYLINSNNSSKVSSMSANSTISFLNVFFTNSGIILTFAITILGFFYIWRLIKIQFKKRHDLGGGSFSETNYKDADDPGESGGIIHSPIDSYSDKT